MKKQPNPQVKNVQRSRAGPNQSESQLKISTKAKIIKESKKGRQKDPKKDLPPSLPPDLQKESPTQDFPIAGIGSSAGGLEPLKVIFSHVPVDTGIGYVIIQHLDPNRESMTAEILSRETSLPVTQITEGLEVEKNHVYVLPHGHNVAISGRIFKLFPRAPESAMNLPIDFFLKSLAAEHKKRAIGIVLSGTGSDGSAGVIAIGENGGVAIVQEPKSSQYDAMPQSAIATGSVAHILTPIQIALELKKLGTSRSNNQKPADLDENHQLVANTSVPQNHQPPAITATTIPTAPTAPTAPNLDGIGKIVAIIRGVTGVDFSHYKQSTLQRRILRRMLLQKTKSFLVYATFLENHPDEVKALLGAILIHVTVFFRDKSVFEALKVHLKESLQKDHDQDVPLRIWIPGCSTGEEVYSIAIACCEIQESKKNKRPIMIFGSDLSDQALRVARAGVYDESTTKKAVSTERLSKYFEKNASGKLRVVKYIREMCVFSRHDVTKDPPFAKVDLISCRNLLIYIDGSLQQNVVPIFHYALKPDGLLLLGKSESIGNFGSLFKARGNTDKIYSKINTTSPLKLPFSRTSHLTVLPKQKKAVEFDPSTSDLVRLADRMAISLYVPANVLINESLDIIYSKGKTAPFLSLPSGHPTHNILRMAHPALVSDLKALIASARQKGNPQVKSNLVIHDEGQRHSFSVRVAPLATEKSTAAVYDSIFFQIDSVEKIKKKSGQDSIKGRKQASEYLELEKKLSANHDFQTTLIEDFQVAQEELVSSNEDLQSINEELQSTNEELETAKEELQSTNEELSTVNDQMQTRNVEIASLNQDLKNLLEGSSVPIVMVNAEGRIRLYTPNAAHSLQLGPSDVGKLIDEVGAMEKVPHLEQIISEVIGTKTVKEFEIQDPKGHWYNLQARPSVQGDEEATGAVLSLLDIDKIKRSREDATAIIDALPIPLLVIDKNQVVKISNEIFCSKFKVLRSETEGQLVSKLGDGQWNIPKLLTKLSENFSKNLAFDNFEVETRIPSLGRRTLRLHGRRIQLSGAEEPATLLVLVDISEIRQTEMALLESEKNRHLTDLNKKLMEETAAQEKNLRDIAEKANTLKDEFLALLSHELRTPLSAIYSWAQQLLGGKLDAEKTIHGIKVIYQSAKAQSQLVDDLLDISRIQSGKLSLSIMDTDIRKVVSAAIDSTLILAENKQIQVKVEINPNVGVISADPVRLEQILWNLIINGIKFSPPGSHIFVQAELVSSSSGDQLSLQVIDKGKGIDKEFLPIIFNRFTQVDSSSTRMYGGLGLGLAIVKKLVELHEGTITAESPGEGQGSTFRVLLPVRRPIIEGLDTHSAEATHAMGTCLQGLKVLVVEDDPFSREIFTITIQSFGAEVQAVESAQNGFEALSTFRPDILVSDLSMPCEDGFTFIKKVRGLPVPMGNIPAIALTAHAGLEDIEKALRFGFQAHLVKPVDGNKLALLISRLSGRS